VKRPAVRIVFAPRVPAISGRTVRLDPRAQDVAEVLCRALLRMRHPAWSARAIRTTAKHLWLRKTWREKAEVYRMLGSAKLEGER